MTVTFKQFTWAKLASSAIVPDSTGGILNVRFSPIDGSLVAWNNTTGQWQSYTPQSGWSAVGTFANATPILAVSPGYLGRYLAICDAGGLVSFQVLTTGSLAVNPGQTVKYVEMPGYVPGRYVCLSSRHVFVNAYKPGVCFIQAVAGVSCWYLGIDIVSGQPVCAILSDLNDAIYVLQNAGTASSVAQLGAENGLFPGLMQLTSQIDAPAHYLAYVDFYRMSLLAFTNPTGNTAILEKYDGVSGGSPTGGASLSVWAGGGGAVTPYMYATPTLPFPSSLPGQQMTPPMRAAQVATIPQITSSTTPIGIMGLNGAALPGLVGNSLSSVTYVPLPGLRYGLPVTIAAPAGLDNAGNANNVSLGMIAGDPYLYDTAGQLWALLLASTDFAGLHSLSNWTHKAVPR